MKTGKIKILVFVQGTIGDMIVSIPALKALRRHYGSSASITLLHEVHPNLSFSVRSVAGEIDLVQNILSYPFSFSYWQFRLSIIRLYGRLVRAHFDAVFYLIAMGREPRQVRRDRLFFTLCGISQRFGFRIFDEADVQPRGADRSPLHVKNEALVRLDLVADAGIDVTQDREFSPPLFELPPNAVAEVDRWLENQPGFHAGRPLIAIAPGAKKASCLWSLSRFAEVGAKILKNYSANLIVIGGSAERDAGIALTEAWNAGLNACGQLSVLGTAALLRRCRLLFGLDTGTTHLAAAMGTPCVAIYAAQDWPGRWDPLGPGHVILRYPVPCAGCRLNVCNVAGHPCTTGITGETAWNQVSRRLDELAASPPCAE